jgi:hypothetical protein
MLVGPAGIRLAEWASRTCEREPSFYDVVFRESGD